MRTPIRQLMAAETVTLINTHTVNGYYHVRTTNGQRGWLYRANVKINATVSTTPAAATLDVRQATEYSRSNPAEAVRVRVVTGRGTIAT